jgi:hypothetical protein
MGSTLICGITETNTDATHSSWPWSYELEAATSVPIVTAPQRDRGRRKTVARNGARR